MRKYRIHYSFNGEGTAIVKANNKKEAEDKFNDGEDEEEEEKGNNYEVYEIDELQPTKN